MLVDLVNLKNLQRLFFAALFIFELLNFFGVLNFPLAFTWLGLIVTLVVTVLVLELINLLWRWLGMTLHWSNWTLAFLVIFIDVLGDIFQWYARWPWFDQVAHGIGGSLAAIFFINVLKNYWQITAQRRSVLMTALVAYSLSMTVSAWYEIEEYLEDYFTGSQRLGDGPDTANDLLMGALGAGVVVLIFILGDYFWSKWWREDKK